MTLGHICIIIVLRPRIREQRQKKVAVTPGHLMPELQLNLSFSGSDASGQELCWLDEVEGCRCKLPSLPNQSPDLHLLSGKGDGAVGQKSGNLGRERQ